MKDILIYLEQAGPTVADQIILPAGVLFTLLGLCIWLGGLRWKRFAAAIVFALIACVLTVIIAPEEPRFIPFSVLAGVVFALLLPRTAMIALTAAAGAGLCIAFFSPAALEFDWQEPYVDISSEEKLTVDQSLKLSEDYMISAGNAVFSVLKSVKPVVLFLGFLTAVIIICFGIFLTNLVAAVAFSAIGVRFIFTGMAFLLIYKGSQPISRIMDNPSYFVVIAGLMVLFGVLTQILLRPTKKREKKQPELAKPAEGGGQ